MEVQLRAHLKPSVHHITIVLRGLRGALNLAPLYTETSASRIADVIFLQSGLIKCNKFREFFHNENAKTSLWYHRKLTLLMRTLTRIAIAIYFTIAMLLHWENCISISFYIGWDMILNIYDIGIESKTVTTIISHSIWKEMEI